MKNYTFTYLRQSTGTVTTRASNREDAVRSAVELVEELCDCAVDEKEASCESIEIESVEPVSPDDL